MNIKLIGKPKIIMNAPGNSHNYFAWPTVTRLKDGRIAAACSGFRVAHICPFGKAVISFSEDEGESFTAPSPVIDTVLDDRDAGLCAFGESGLIVTSFNNTVDFQRGDCEPLKECYDYLDTVDPEDEKKALGSEFRISFDNGSTWSEIYHSPVTSPHGPLETKDGRILWTGQVFNCYAPLPEDIPHIQTWEINPGNGEMTYVGGIDNIYENGKIVAACEPHTVELCDGTLVCHIRVERGEYSHFTVFESKSKDGGKTWSKPEKLLKDRGGSPAHLLQHSSGTLISAYGYRELPYGIRVMLSADGGKTWEKDKILYEQTVTADIGYPATVELKDGSLLTVFYAHGKEDEPAAIWAQKWEIEN